MERKKGFFGSVKQLGVTTVTGANAIVTDTVTTATGLTGATATVSTVVKEATNIWGANILDDLRFDGEMDSIQRELDREERMAELEAMKERLGKRKPGRPKTK